MTHTNDQVKIGVLQKDVNMGSFLPFFKRGPKLLLLQT